MFVDKARLTTSALVAAGAGAGAGAAGAAGLADVCRWPA